MCVTVCITIVVQSMAVGRRGQNGSRVLSTRLRSQSLTRRMSVAVKHDRVTVRHLVTTDRHAAETPFKSPTALVSTPHTLSVKKQDTKLLPITSPNANRFSKTNFNDRLGGKFATKSCLNIPPHLNCVATLPCEISMLKKRRPQEVIEANCRVRLSCSSVCRLPVSPVDRQPVSSSSGVQPVCC